MHCLIVGTTRSGKTTLAKQLCKRYIAQGINCLVNDPHGTVWPSGARMYADINKLLAVAQKSQRCALFIEEAGQSVGRGRTARELQWLTTGSAKYGHRTHLIAQTAQQIDPTVRTQCGQLFTFKQSRRNAELLADDFAEPRIIEAMDLPQYHFLSVISCGDVKRYKLTL